MSEVKPSAYVALLGDLVGSRSAPARSDLHRRLVDALAAANTGRGVLDPLRVTAGDEFQGVFATVGDALAATYRVRLGLRPADVRFGLGVGTVEVIDRDANVQDGSAWWAARAAIEAVETAARGARRALRTGIGTARDLPRPVGPLLAAVELVDAALYGLDDADAGILVGLRAGRSQAEAAAELGVTPSAVSQRVARGGLAILADAMTRLEEAR